MGTYDERKDIKLRSLINLGLDFSSMLRLYLPDSKNLLLNKIYQETGGLWKVDSRESFNAWHEVMCEWGTQSIQLSKGNSATYGQVAKTMNVVLSVLIYYGHQPNCDDSSRLASWLHAAVDNKMMKMLKRNYPQAFNKWPSSVYQVDSRKKYETIQDVVCRYISDHHPGITPVEFDDIYWWKLNKDGSKGEAL